MEKKIDETTASYLAMIQEPVSRLSTASSVFKGFTATIVTGIAALSYTDMSIFILALSYIPVFAFAALDAYPVGLQTNSPASSFL